LREIIFLFRAKHAKPAKGRRTEALGAHLAQRHPPHKGIPLALPPPYNELNTRNQMDWMDNMDGM